MTNRDAIWRRAAALAGEEARAALATVARQRGSLPMASDAKMLVADDGRRWGTIGGGCLEADVTQQALEALYQRKPALVRHTLNADVAGDLGLSCGGTVDLFLEPLVTTPDSVLLLEAVACATDQRQSAVVLTALDWSQGPRKCAYVSGVAHSLGGWQPEQWSSRVPRAAHLDESAGVFVEPLPRAPRLLIFGAGHVGCEIARAAAATDFQVLVVDDREEFANRDRFPTAQEIRVADFRQVLDDLRIEEDDYVIACTRGHSMDAIIVERTAGSVARYVGMLGSKRKREVIWKALEQAGVARSALNRVKVPIGESIGADTPGEIGISVMAELIKIRRLSPSLEAAE